MGTKIIKFALTILLVCINFHLTGCLKRLPPDEAAYKSAVNGLNSLLEPYGNIKIRSETKDISENNPEEYILVTEYNKADIKKREDYYYKHESEWQNYEGKFKNITTSYPDSSWADDSAFMQSLMYYITRHPFSPLVSKRTESYNQFLDIYPTFQLENWTKSQFKNWFTYAFELSSEDTPDVEQAKIRGRIHVALIAEYGQIRDIKNAEKAYKRLQADSLSLPRFIDAGKSLLEFYRKPIN